MAEESKEKKIWFKNHGGPYRHTDGSIKAPGKSFKAYPSEISAGLRTHIKPLEELPDPGTEPLPAPTGETGYELKSKGGAYYNVIQKNTGKIVNEKGLRKADAEALIISLEE